MKQYLKCLIFAACAALILSLPAGIAKASATRQEAVKGIETKVAEVPKPPDSPPPANPVQTALAPQPEPAPIPDTPPAEPKLQAPIGDHEQLLADAGIPASEWNAADKIIQLESSWNTGAVEPHTGACGLAQELPCGKSGCDTSNAVCTLKWANTYVVGRYGSWGAALSFHYAHNWY